MSQERYVIISSTNRKKANSYKLSKQYQHLLKQEGIEAPVLDLAELPVDFVFSALYDQAQQNKSFNSLIEMVNEAEKLVFVVPEYNGSFPGVLKAFIDGMDYPHTFKGKKAALVGHSAGSQGSALALSHLTDILNYLGTNVLSLKPRLMLIDKYIGQEGTEHPPYLALLEEQIEMFKSF